MKKFFVRTISLALVVFTLFSMTSCGKKGAAMKIGREKMTEQMYAYLMSCYRPYWLYSFNREDNAEFWNSSTADVTVKDYLQDVTLTAIKSKLAAAYLFEEYDLQLTDAMEKEIESLVKNLLLGVGGEAALKEDPLMDELNMDIDDMEDIFRLNAKAEMLQTYLYGDQGIEKVTNEEMDNYYKTNYYRYQHLYIMDVDFVRDENGNIVYDEDKVAKWEEISEERWDEKFEMGKSLLERAEKGEDFEQLIKDYTEEIGWEKYPYGHYICATSATESNYFPDILENVKVTEIGGVRLFRSDYGLHLIKRLELDEKGYEHEENADDFADLYDMVVENKFKDRLAKEFEKITINQKIIDKYPINQVPYSESWTYVF